MSYHKLPRPGVKPAPLLAVAVACFACSAFCLLMLLVLITSSGIVVLPSSNASESGTEEATVKAIEEGLDTLLSSTGNINTPIQDAIEPVQRTSSGAWSDSSQATAMGVIGTSDVEGGEELLSRMPDVLLEKLTNANAKVSISSHPLAGMLAASGGEDSGGYICPSYKGDALSGSVMVDGTSTSGFAHGMGHVCYAFMGDSFREELAEAIKDIEARAGAGFPEAEMLVDGVDLADGGDEAESFAVIFERFVSTEPGLLAASPMAWEMMARVFGSHIISDSGFEQAYELALDKGVVKAII